MIRWAGVVGALGLLTGVALGAFAAHGLRTRISADMLAIFETGVRYQIIHSLLLVILGWMASARLPFVWAAGCYTAGIVVFSGSLYLLALTGTRAWGAITPFGGVAFLLGHGALLWGFLKM